MPNDHVGRGAADCDRSSGRRGSGGEGEDWAGHERADRAKREDGWSENVTPNSHDYPHALTEVKRLRPGIGGPIGLQRPIFLFASLWLLT